MEPTYAPQVVKCPQCKSNINISVGRYPGGVNDSGGWVLQCSTCSRKFPLPVKNPDDLSRVVSGASVVASWDNDLNDKPQVLEDHGLADHPADIERLLIMEVGEPEDFYDLGTHPLYQCGSCGKPVDAAAYAALAAELDAVNSAIGSHVNFYLAGRDSAPEGVSVRTKFACECGAEHSARFFRMFSESSAENATEFWLINVDGPAKTLDIDGIYSRDDCIAILEKLLLRWRATHSAVLLAAPFVGFNYPGARKKIPDLWNWVLKYTDPEKTSIITRKATFKLLKDTSKDTEMDVDFLKSWGLLNPTLETLDEKRAFFKTDFHAKFYCGMSADLVEILVGSFNIHEGTYVENIHLLRYAFPDFARRYLLGMKMFFDTTLLKKNRRILEISMEAGRVAGRRIVKYEDSLDSPAIT